MPLLEFSKATTRDTPCYWIWIDKIRILISYETPVAFVYKNNKYRRGKDWGPTTERHLKETNCYHYDTVDKEDDFNELLDTALRTALVEHVARRLNP